MELKRIYADKVNNSIKMTGRSFITGKLQNLDYDSYRVSSLEENPALQ